MFLKISESTWMKLYWYYLSVVVISFKLTLEWNWAKIDHDQNYRVEIFLTSVRFKKKVSFCIHLYSSKGCMRRQRNQVLNNRNMSRKVSLSVSSNLGFRSVNMFVDIKWKCIDMYIANVIRSITRCSSCFIDQVVLSVTFFFSVSQKHW